MLLSNWGLTWNYSYKFQMNVKRKNGCNILIQIIIIGKREAKRFERLSSIKINIKHKTLPIWHFYFVLNIHNIEYRIIGWKRQIGPDIELRKEENQYFVIQGNLYHSLPPPFTIHISHSRAQIISPFLILLSITKFILNKKCIFLNDLYFI